MTPLYIFDLDGTLANIEHRLHHVRIRKGSRVRMVGDPNDLQGTVEAIQNDAAEVRWDRLHEHRLYIPISMLKLIPDWDAFHAACVDDTPIMPTLTLLDTLADSHPVSPPDVQVWSGRMNTVFDETSSWFDHHIGWCPPLRMRPARDYTLDEQLKERWLHALSPEDRARLVMVFDDRQRVVNMWRRNGVVCAQVAPGAF